MSDKSVDEIKRFMASICVYLNAELSTEYCQQILYFLFAHSTFSLFSACFKNDDINEKKKVYDPHNL